MPTDPLLFTVLDAARMGSTLSEARQLAPNHTSLYAGRSAEILADYAPYLFSLDPESAFSDWFFTNGWGNAWGICCRSLVSGAELYRHFRRFLMVELEGGQPIYFRFYDPRVLRRFLPTCTAKQLDAFFGPIDYFWLEDEDPNYGLYLWPDNGELITYRVGRDEMELVFNQTQVRHVRDY